MDIINKDLGLEFTIVDYEFPVIWAANPLGKNADWLLMEFNYIDKDRQVTFQSAPLLSKEFAEIADVFEKVVEGHILGYKGVFEYTDFNISFKNNEGVISAEVSIENEGEVYRVSEEFSPQRLEEFSVELREEADYFPPRV